MVGGTGSTSFRVAELWKKLSESPTATIVGAVGFGLVTLLEQRHAHRFDSGQGFCVESA